MIDNDTKTYTFKEVWQEESTGGSSVEVHEIYAAGYNRGLELACLITEGNLFGQAISRQVAVDMSLDNL